MKNLFAPEVYSKRRQSLAGGIGKGIILIAGNHNSPINYSDNYYPFRQDSNFLYYAGHDVAGMHLTIDCATGEATLYGTEPTIDSTIWTGHRPSLRELADKAAIEHTAAIESIHNACRGHELHCLPPYRAEHFRLYQAITEHSDCSSKPSLPLIRAVIAQREIKEDREVQQMEQALAVTSEMHTALMRMCRPGMREAVLAGTAEGIAVANGGRLAYGAIVTRNGHILHNHDYGNTLRKGDLLLCDMGAESPMHYASDITRTFPVSGKFEPRHADIYNIVLEAQVKAINACRPGQKFVDVHLLASQIIADGLVALGLMKGDPEEAVRHGAHALFFPHGLGHMIGFDVHDMEGLGEDRVGYGDEVERSDQFGLKALRLGRTLTPGMVVTVEPGIYFIPDLIDRWREEKKCTDFIQYEALESWKSFSGIRIEDDVLITDQGQRILGPAIPKTIAEIEAVSD